jgi:uncharacterized protein YbaR (Trm112 family)
VRHEQHTEDLIGEAMRRAYRIPSRVPEHFQDLLRRLSDKEGQEPELCATASGSH